MTTAKKDLRAEMPESAAFIDRMRAAFGKDMVDLQIRRALKGEPTFFAIENGVMIGAINTRSRWHVLWNKRGISYTIEADWICWARLIGLQHGEQLPRLDPNANDSENHLIADRARAILAAATPDEIHSARLINRDDYQ